jgi:cytochrome c5
MGRPSARRHGRGIEMIVVGVGRQLAFCSGGAAMEAGNDCDAFWRPRWAQGQGALEEASVDGMEVYASSGGDIFSVVSPVVSDGN